MKKALLFFGLAISMIGCNNPLNKTITKDLTTEEIKTICDKDSSFLVFYNEYFVNNSYKQFLSDKSEQVLYGDITYKELFDFDKNISDKSWVSSIVNKSEKEWNEKYAYDEIRFDSIISYWENYLSEKALNSYLDIEFDHYVVHGSEADVYFKLTPKKQKLYSVDFYFSVVSKETNNTILSQTTAWYNKPFSEPIIVSTLSGMFWFKICHTYELTNEELKKNYTFDYQINSISTNEKEYLKEYEIYKNVPLQIKEYIDEPVDYMKEKIIQEFIDSNYKSLALYQLEYYWEKVDELNPKCYGFYKIVH